MPLDFERAKSKHQPIVIQQQLWSQKSAERWKALRWREGFGYFWYINIPTTIQLYLFDYKLLDMLNSSCQPLLHVTFPPSTSIQTPEFSEVELKSLTFHSSLILSPPNSAFNKQKKIWHSISFSQYGQKKKTNLQMYAHHQKKIKIWKLKYFIS